MLASFHKPAKQAGMFITNNLVFTVKTPVSGLALFFSISWQLTHLDPLGNLSENEQSLAWWQNQVVTDNWTTLISP